MTQNRDTSALIDIYIAAEKALEFIEGYDERAFMADERTISAVQHQLLIIGEAVKRLTPEFRTQHPEIRWALMAGMRDILIHAYDTVDIEEVWRTVSSKIPHLILNLTPLLPANFRE